MIPAIHPRGTNVGGLLRYLFGPGKREEHVRPRVIAAWDGSDPLARLQPPVTTRGRPDVRRLTELLAQPVASAWNPPAQTVWHCSIRNHPTDRTLTDAHWAHIAGEVMAAVGLAPHGDAMAVRWVAIRHNADHVHLVATLVRQDRRTAWAWKDKLHAQQACRDLEERYGLYRVGPPGTGSRRWPRPAELNKAARLGQRDRRGRPAPARDRLRRQVRAAAAVAEGEADFFARLRGAGVQVRLRHSSRDPDQVTGYAVGLADHPTTSKDPIWYGGGRLAPDLTLPRLRARWADAPPERSRPTAPRLVAAAFPPPDLYQRAADTVRQASTAMRAAPGPVTASAIASAAADLLTSTAQAWEGRRGGPLTDAAELFDRAARELRRRSPARRVSQAVELRSMARLVALMGVISGDRDTAAALHLIYTFAALAENLADLREAQQRLHQARDARAAAAQLRIFTAPPRHVRTRAQATTPTDRLASRHGPSAGQRYPEAGPHR